MSEQPRENYQTPWGMPDDIFWDHGESADLNRLHWLWDNKTPELTLGEIFHVMPFRDDVLNDFLEDIQVINAINAHYDHAANGTIKPLTEQQLSVAAQALKLCSPNLTDA